MPGSPGSSSPVPAKGRRANKALHGRHFSAGGTARTGSPASSSSPTLAQTPPRASASPGRALFPGGAGAGAGGGGGASDGSLPAPPSPSLEAPAAVAAAAAAPWGVLMLCCAAASLLAPTTTTTTPASAPQRQGGAGGEGPEWGALLRKEASVLEASVTAGGGGGGDAWTVGALRSLRGELLWVADAVADLEGQVRSCVARRTDAGKAAAPQLLQAFTELYAAGQRQGRRQRQRQMRRERGRVEGGDEGDEGDEASPPRSLRLEDLRAELRRGDAASLALLLQGATADGSSDGGGGGGAAPSLRPPPPPLWLRRVRFPCGGTVLHVVGEGRGEAARVEDLAAYVASGGGGRDGFADVRDELGRTAVGRAAAAGSAASAAALVRAVPAMAPLAPSAGGEIPAVEAVSRETEARAARLATAHVSSVNSGGGTLAAVQAAAAAAAEAQAQPCVGVSRGAVFAASYWAEALASEAALCAAAGTVEGWLLPLVRRVHGRRGQGGGRQDSVGAEEAEDLLAVLLLWGSSDEATVEGLRRVREWLLMREE